MALVKHIGKHGDQKVAIVFREVPGEEHMALVVYPDKLQRAMHDSIMEVLESTKGQEAEQLADPLSRSMLPDGRVILNTLHKEGLIKKVRTQEIIVTPNPQSHVRLDELNDILNGMRDGSEAAKKMEELDANAGLVDPVEKTQADNLVSEAGEGVLDDSSLAKDQLEQSKRMAAEAESLLNESKRLEKEAYEMDPSLKPKRTRKKAAKKKTAAKKKS